MPRARPSGASGVSTVAPSSVVDFSLEHHPKGERQALFRIQHLPFGSPARGRERPPVTCATCGRPVRLVGATGRTGRWVALMHDSRLRAFLRPAAIAA